MAKFIFVDKKAPNGGGGSRGLLTLVDCAGSERKEDSNKHDVQRQKEGAEINTSLHALKECIRFKALQQSKIKKEIEGCGVRAEKERAEADKNKHVASGANSGVKIRIPYRASNLTKNVFGTNVSRGTVLGRQMRRRCLRTPSPSRTRRVL